MKIWIQTLRLRTLFLSLSCIMMGIFLSASKGFFNFKISAFAILTALFLQILSNLANDYGDSIHGADHDLRQGPKRPLQKGEISKRQLKNAIAIFVILSLISGTILLYFSFEIIGMISIVSLFIFGLLAIAAAIFYTNGKRPYGYVGLGDVSVFLFFGLLAVYGTFYIHSGKFILENILPAASCGLFSVAVLNINNMRDIDSDRIAGKKSIPVRLGFDKSKIYHYILISMACIISLIFLFENYFSFKISLVFLSVLLFVYHMIKVKKTKDKQELDPLLKELSLSIFLFVIVFGLAIMQ